MTRSRANRDRRTRSPHNNPCRDLLGIGDASVGEGAPAFAQELLAASEKVEELWNEEQSLFGRSKEQGPVEGQYDQGEQNDGKAKRARRDVSGEVQRQAKILHEFADKARQIVEA